MLKEVLQISIKENSVNKELTHNFNIRIKRD